MTGTSASRQAVRPTEQSLTVVELYEPSGEQDMEARMAFLRSLRDSGVLLMAALHQKTLEFYRRRGRYRSVIVPSNASAAMATVSDSVGWG
jgi:hypothetical protein